MVYFSKEELCMIEMLTYFNKASEAIYQAIGIAEKERVTFSGDMTNRTVGEILRNFTQDNINKLKEIDDIIDTEFFISGKEWAQILEYVLYSNNGNSEIAKLKLADLFIKDKGTPEDESDDIVLGLCFTDNIDDPDEAIVAFIGTADNEEWYDDVRAAKMTSSPCQQDAYNYINGLRFRGFNFTDITVTGHSKGGNKAMYVTVMCDNITRCVSFDGQGFSYDFLSKYAEAINDRASIITNYSLSTDFVHILLEQLPGSIQKYCNGYGISSPENNIGYILAQNHSPNSFFKTDTFGLITDDGISGRKIPLFDITSENESTILLKKYVNSLLKSKERSAYNALINYVERIMRAVLENNDLEQAILSSIDQLGTIVGYTINFIESNELDLDDAKEILYSLGLDKSEIVLFITDLLGNKKSQTEFFFDHSSILDDALKHLVGKQLTDGEDDWILQQLIWRYAGDELIKHIDVIDFYNLWDTIEDKYEEAQENENSYYNLENGAVRDCVKYMRTNDFLKIVNNDNRIISEVDKIEAYIDNYKDTVDINNIIYSLTILNSFSNLKKLLEEYGYRLNVGDDNGNYRKGNNVNSITILGNGDDLFFGGRYKDIIIGGDGNDTIVGGDGDDTIYCGEGFDQIYGGKGNDTIYGDDGNKYIKGGDGNDTIYASSGIGTPKQSGIIEGGKGDDILIGSYANDNLYGGDDNDTIYGDSGDDTLLGNAGNDTLEGGSGVDTLYGHDGNDTYIFNKDIYGSASNQGHVNDHDTVWDMYGNETILFKNVPKDVEKLQDIIKFEKQDNDLVIKSKQTGASMIIRFYYNDNQERYTFKIDGSNVRYTINEDMELVEKKSELGSHSFPSSQMENIRSHTTSDLSDKFIEASQTFPPRDPLIIDLNSDGIHITNVENGVYFDIDNNGFAEKTAWIDTIDGFLVYNRDDDARITNGSELFSDQVILPNGKKSTDGFEVLKTFDTNDDGFVDKKDSNFAELGVWIDKDHNGETWLSTRNNEIDEARKELFTLEELGIISISTDFRIIEDDDENKTIEADVTMNGKNTTISEHWFDAVTSDTLELNTECIDDDLTSFGNLHSVSYALENDTDGTLQNLMDSFKATEDYVERRVLTKKILYHISGAENINSKSRGGYIDARELHILETIMGVDTFLGVGNTKNPNTNAADILRKMYAEFEELYFNLLNKDSQVSYALDMIVEISDDEGNAILDMNSLNATLDSMMNFNAQSDDVICSICSYLKTYDNAYKTNYFNQFVTAHPDAVETIKRYNNKAIILCNESNNTFNGTSADEIFWAENDNITINASSGDDIIYGGDGNDKLNAGDGNDIVYGGNGNDTVNAGSGNDTIYGGKGDDNLNGDGGNDAIYGENGNDTINGDAGDDILYGGKGNDVINGGADDDTIYGGEGDDSISGGTGDDVLYGDIGDDIYYINAEHGNDVIHDSMGLSILVFGDELSADDYSLSIDINNGMILVHNETGETIGLSDFINNPMNYDFIFDGESKILGGGDSRHFIDGTNEDDVITGEDGFNIIYGDNGNDTIIGGDNLNFIYGGNGDDTITGGNGTNIIRGENGDDVIRDGSGDSYLDGGDGNDTIHAGAGNDVIIGGNGDDKLHGEDGNDVIAGNDGDDILYGEDGDDTLYADAGNDTLYGGNDNDSLYGGDGDDVIYGENGDDYLEAGNGIDKLYGGTGNDMFVGGEGFNYMYGENGDDIFYGGNALNYMYGGNGDDNFTGGDLADYIEGGAGNDTMNGGNGSNEMYGGDGDDYIYGGNDDDYIEGGNGDDHLYGGNGVNTIYGGAGNDIIFDGDNNSFLYGGDGDDEIRAGGGSDVLDGGAGNDYLQSDHGGDTYVFGIGYDIDTISASADLNTILIHGYMSADMHNSRMANNDLLIDFGKDTGDKLIVQGFFDFNSNRDFNFVFDDETVLGQYDIQAASAPIYGTDADEWLSVQGNDDGIIHAGAGNDGLSGGSGNDELYGEDGDDTLYGNDGNDILDGGTGNDQLNGGNGEDTYIFAKGYAQDSINEWGSDHSIVELADINSDEITVSDQWGSNLLISVNDTEDVLTISNFKWGQSTFTFRFADGAEGYVDRETWQLVLTKQPDEIEDTEQMGAELLESLYEDDTLMSDLLTEDSGTVITDVTESTVLDGDNADSSDMTDIQAMLLAENMSAFGNDDQVYDSMNITDITADTSLTDSLLVGSLQ